jgi:hypothetical protein
VFWDDGRGIAADAGEWRLSAQPLEDRLKWDNEEYQSLSIITDLWQEQELFDFFVLSCMPRLWGIRLLYIDHIS